MKLQRGGHSTVGGSYSKNENNFTCLYPTNRKFHFKTYLDNLLP